MGGGEDYDNACEDEIIAAIRELQRRHQQELEPYFRQLVALRALQPPPPLLVDREWAEKHLIGVNIIP